jgi:hypothetical protein
MRGLAAVAEGVKELARKEEDRVEETRMAYASPGYPRTHDERSNDICDMCRSFRVDVDVPLTRRFRMSLDDCVDAAVL